MTIIALATDFGDGVYVGQMKGVISDRAPKARIVDLFHTVSPQCVLEGAFLLSKSWEYFSEGTIYVVVVDPGVGSGRKIIAVRSSRRTFLAPDNGLLSFIPDAAIDEIRHVENSRLFMKNVSSTFHGRDIFSPVAAALASGARFSGLGRAMKSICRLPDFYPKKSPRAIEGRIAHIDRFGNAVTNLPASRVPKALRVGSSRVISRAKTYSSAPASRVFFLRGSFGTWEISIQNGDAARRLKIKVGQPVFEEAA